MKARVTLLVIVACAVGFSGCAYEKRIGASLPGPPVWVTQVPPDTEDAKVFVGMALADNILDEKTARNRAMEDVRAQIAASLKTNVIRDAIDIVERDGAAHLAQDEADAAYHSQVTSRVEQAMSGVRQDAYYWEKWKIKRGFFSPSFTKYKYYVKAYMSKADYERLQRILAAAIATEWERKGK